MSNKIKTWNEKETIFFTDEELKQQDKEKEKQQNDNKEIIKDSNN